MDNLGNAHLRGNQDLNYSHLYLVRYSEIGLKGKSTRNTMELKLIKNMKSALSRNNISGSCTRERGRIYASTSENADTVFRKIMGIKSFSEVYSMKFSNKEEIVSKVVELFSDIVRNKTIASRVRRSGSHNFSSLDMDRMIGDALSKYASGIDLTSPDVEIMVEIRDTRAYIMKNWIDGPGGLPIGTEGKMISLVSGGIDSPVATWMLLRRGSPVDMLFISMAHPVDTVEFLRAASSLYEDWYNGYNPDIYILDIARLMDQYLFRGKMKYGNVSFKKFIYNMAEMLCQEKGYVGIVTGESSGQVSSQTPENLLELSRNMSYPVHRPLIGMDKDWIVDQARSIGTFQTTSLGDFCALFSDTPITKIKREELEHDMNNISSYTPLESEFIRLKGSESKNMLKVLMEDNFNDDIPDKATFVDLRDFKSYETWHPEGAIQSSPAKINSQVEKLDKSKPIVLYCKKGLQSAHFASSLRKKGYDAYYTDEKNLMKTLMKEKHDS